MEKITLTQLKRELLANKKTREAYEASQLEHEMISALIQARITHKLSQAQVAKKAGMHQSAVARLEAGTSNPRIGTLTRVAAALNVKHVRMN